MKKKTTSDETLMWGDQMSFRISLNTTAETLFKEIDPGLRPNVFLVGIRNDDTKGIQVCVEPEDCGYSASSFLGIKTLAEELEKVDEENQYVHSHPEAQAGHKRRITIRSYIEAIRKILQRQNIYGETEHFVSSPTSVEDYTVFAILELNKKAMNSHYSLAQTIWNDRYWISRSLIESATQIYLTEAANELKDPHRTFANSRSSDEHLREAGRNFMYSVSKAGGRGDGLHGLYDACNMISSLKYEGAEGLGKMVIAKKDHTNIRMTLQLEEPIALRDYRKVRKFLELARDHSYIISDSANIYGLGEIVGTYNSREESLFVINFLSHFKWEVLHDGNSMMLVEYKQPNLPKERVDREKFYSDVSRIFNKIDKRQIDDLWDITMQAVKQKHGTMLVVSDNAKGEASRLGRQCFSLSPIKLQAKMVLQVSSIDGAVLLDRNGICHAIGVILDGLATEKGDSSRGARYNSAIRYYEHFGKSSPTLIVIISEDGMINLVPNLKPQIKHSLIQQAIADLRKIARQTKPNRKEYYRLMSFLQDVEFYLISKECETINSLRDKIEAKNDPTEGVSILWEDLKPNKEMNKSYYK